MRLFIAIELPAEVKKYLRSLQQQLPQDLAKLSLTTDFHLTLKFLGDVTPQKMETLKANLAEVQWRPFTLSLTSIGFFPNEDYIRVVWVGLDNDCLELQKNIENVTATLGFQKEKHFSAHLTLARVKSIIEKDFAKKIMTIKVEPKSFAVKEFHLIQSQLSPKGPKYTVLATYSATS